MISLPNFSDRYYILDATNPEKYTLPFWSKSFILLQRITWATKMVLVPKNDISSSLQCTTRTSNMISAMFWEEKNLDQEDQKHSYEVLSSWIHINNPIILTSYSSQKNTGYALLTVLDINAINNNDFWGSKGVLERHSEVLQKKPFNSFLKEYKANPDMQIYN